ncbi:hypothetical protein K474DRAFT_1704712 [Panus rudis PR-1116 ss-1]|nr:hypothetical protein K474DRAFT_1704712 [Panus rudis PR-1116 ss-1]
MSASEATSSELATKSKSGKEKEKERKQRAGTTSNKRLKTVVRRLPPNLPEEIFWQSVQPWVTDDTVTWKVYYQGKFRKRLNKENVPSRAYIAFKNEELLATFSREYDGHIFRDKAGNESVAIVEFAPFQKVPAEKKKVDSKIGTIEQNEDFISFIESLKEAPSKPLDIDNLESLVAAAQPPPPPTTTPLLEALKAEKSAQKDKEAILRNHAHYKDTPTIATNPQKKDDSKKKSAPSKSAEAHASKKAAKKAAAKAAAQQQQTETTIANPPQIAKNPAHASSQSHPIPVKPAPPKGPKAARERQNAKASASTASNAAPTNPAPAAPSTSQSSNTPSGSTANASAPTSPAPRRVRPVIGLASRQFEAALSGAGVSLGERKSRREREKEAAAETNKGKDGDRTASSSTQPVAPTILQRNSPNQPTAPLPRAASNATPADNSSRNEAPAGRGGRGRGRGGKRGGRGG